jgi:2-methylcitrate dehydratase PrpD
VSIMRAEACLDYLDSLLDRIMMILNKRPKEVIDSAHNALIDFVAVVSTAYHYRRDSVQKLLALSKGNEGCVPGPWKRTGRFNAIALNSYLAHSLELDDWIPSGYVHAGAAVIPVVFSFIGYDFNLEELLTAIAIGYEAAGGIGRCLGRDFYDKWHTTSTAGAVGASLTAYVLLNSLSVKDKEELSLPILATLNYSGGLWILAKEYRYLKPLSASHAALQGYLTALMNKFLGKNADRVKNRKLFEKICKELHSEACKESLPNDLFINLNEYKFYPSCRHTHTAIEAALKIRRHIKDVGKIRRIEIHTFKEALRIANVELPRDVEEAKFSIKYLVALALLYGEVSLESIRKGIKDPQVVRLVNSIKVVENERYTSMYPHYQPSKIVIYLNDHMFEEEVLLPLGSPKRGIERNILVKKARGLLGPFKDSRSLEFIDELYKVNKSIKITELVGRYC